MSNPTTLNVVIVAVASMTQPVIFPGIVQKGNPFAHQYINNAGTNLTKYYNEVSQVQASEQLVLRLADKLVNNSHDIPTELNQIISDNFWDLV